MHIVAHLAYERGGSAELAGGDQDVCGRAAGGALEHLLAVLRGAHLGEVDEELAQGGNGILGGHVHPFS